MLPNITQQIVPYLEIRLCDITLSIKEVVIFAWKELMENKEPDKTTTIMWDDSIRNI